MMTLSSENLYFLGNMVWKQSQESDSDFSLSQFLSLSLLLSLSLSHILIPVAELQTCLIGAPKTKMGLLV